jgi:transcriptional regulator with XRE-family HTH domain
MKVASRIREGRQAMGLSQRELAARMRVSASAVAQWETGQTLPSVSNRVDISRLLRIPLIDLMPEATRSLTVMLDNPLLLAIVQQVLKLPPPVQEALLAQLAATAEALDAHLPPPPPNKPKR